MAAPRTTVADAPSRARRRGGRPLTAQGFIERAVRKHGDRYVRSQVNCVDSLTPVTAGTSPDRADAVYRDTVARDAMGTGWAAANGWTLVRLANRSTTAIDSALAGVLGAPAPEVSAQ